LRSALTILASIAALLLAKAASGEPPTKEEDDKLKKPGTVLTFYGLRKLEQDPKISDEEKMREWQEFIQRSAEQVEYARKAVARWKDAAKIRVVEAASKSDQDPALLPRDKVAKWKEVVDLYPKSKEARQAQKRLAFWTAAETKRLAEAAEAVEKGRKPKVERIKAWMDVLTWTEKGPEARAAERRIADLQDQLFAEAKSVDDITRVDKQTKLEAWRDVLNGRPTQAQRNLAKKRVEELESELVQDETSMRKQ
jgi:hypothetical protein